MRQLVLQEKLPYDVDSAGTSASHRGDAPDPRSVKAAAQYSFKGLRSRPVRDEDFNHYDLILAMDESNLRELQRRCPAGQQHKIKLLLEYHPEFPKWREVPDPYYGGSRGFELVLQLIEAACENLLRQLR
jgi:protein-tyrosine phosphatase